MNVQLWISPVERWCVDPATPSMLSPREHGRWAEISHDGAARRFLAASALSRRVLAELLHTSPVNVPLSRRCDCGAEHGRPEVDAAVRGQKLDLSISHTQDWVVVAVGRGVRVGVDIETSSVPRSRVERALLAGLMDDEPDAVPGCSDLNLIRWWTRKEAVAKATGLGVQTRLRGIRVSHPRRSPRVLHYDGQDPAAFRLWDVPLRSDVQVSVCAFRSAAL